MNQSFEIIKELNLDRYLKIVIKFSNSNKAPYHNFYHIMCKIKHTYNIAKSQGYLPKAIRTLVLADLFHDFNHSMGEHDDAWNVKEAIKSFLQHSIETEETNKKVISLIQATQYPYVISEDDVDLDQKITRDSDLLQQYEDNYIQQVYFGLSEELKRPFEEIGRAHV